MNIVRSSRAAFAGRGFALASLITFASSAFAEPAAESAGSAEPAWMLGLELQRVDTSDNDLRKGDGYSGTRWQGIDYTGRRGDGGRVELTHVASWLRPNDELRFVIAPLRDSGTAAPSTPIFFDGAKFPAGVPLSVVYKFNTYRFTYDAPVWGSLRSNAVEMRLGGTLAIRDARVLVSQPGLSRNFYNWGPVPLLYFSTAIRPAARLTWMVEFDAFPAPGGGGLFDGVLKASYAVSRQFAVTAGGRYVDGGAAGPDFYNHLRQRAAVLGLIARF